MAVAGTMQSLPKEPGIAAIVVSGWAAQVAEQWKNWLGSFRYYVDGAGFTDAQRRKSLLLHFASSEVQDILTDPGAPQ